MNKYYKFLFLLLGVILITGCSGVETETNNISIECNKTFVDNNNITIGKYDCEKLICEEYTNCNYDNLI